MAPHVSTRMALFVRRRLRNFCVAVSSDRLFAKSPYRLGALPLTTISSVARMVRPGRRRTTWVTRLRPPLLLIVAALAEAVAATDEGTGDAAQVKSREHELDPAGERDKPAEPPEKPKPTYLNLVQTDLTKSGEGLHQGFAIPAWEILDGF